MGTLTIRIVNESDPPFADPSILDACIDPQFNGVFPDDPALGIVSERKANVLPADPRVGNSTSNKDKQIIDRTRTDVD